MADKNVSSSLGVNYMPTNEHADFSLSLEGIVSVVCDKKRRWFICTAAHINCKNSGTRSPRYGSSI